MIGELPVVAVTMGDPAGIGPEIVWKALETPEVRAACYPVILGTEDPFNDIRDLLGSKGQIEHLEQIPINGSDVNLSANAFPLLTVTSPEQGLWKIGEASEAAGRLAVDTVLAGGRLALEGRIDAMATAPINKKAAEMAGHKDIGHLELLARLSGAGKCATMLMAGSLRTIHLSTHRSLRQACDLVTKDNIVELLRLSDTFFRNWGIKKPRFLVAALNPHAGDGGLIGREEEDEIAPAVMLARSEGMEAEGPVPADSVFFLAMERGYDAVLVMYHDQGHIPIKALDFHGSVSLTLGLPFIRTSVDHGTAFDIAGQGIANPDGMVASILTAARLARGLGL